MSKSRTEKVLILSFGQAAVALGNLVLFAVLSRILTRYEYAVYRQTFLAYNFVKPLLMLSLPMAIFYFMPTEKDRRRSLLYENLLLLFLMGWLFATFLLLGGNRLLAWQFGNPDIIRPLRWIALYAVFMLPAGAISACLTVQERITTLTIYTILSQLFTLVCVIAACLIWKNPNAAILAQAATAVVSGIAALFLMLDSVPREPIRIQGSSMLKMVQYAVPLGLASMLGTITLQLDKMIVSSMCSPEIYAVYANGAIEIPLFSVITGSIAVVILSDMRKMIVDNEKRAALGLFKKAAVKSGAILLPSMVFLFLFADPLIRLIYSEKYMDSVLPFRLYLLILPVRIVYFGSALMALGKTRIVMYRSLLGLLVNLVLSILFVQMWGYIGAVIATLAALYFCNVLINLKAISTGFECRMIEVLPLAELLKMFAWCLISGLLLFLLNRMIFQELPSLVSLILCCSLYIPLTLTGFSFLNVMPLKIWKKQVHNHE